MYKLTIQTKYNVINLIIEDINSPEVKEILEQPYIIKTFIEEINNEGSMDVENTPSFKILLSKGKNYEKK